MSARARSPISTPTAKVRSTTSTRRSNSKPTTVAVQVRGHSLGVLFDNWLVFYDDIRNPPDDSLVGRMCVCGLSDGRVLIKSVKRSPQTGLWNLLSNTEPPIYDAGLDWAAPVREMRPR